MNIDLQGVVAATAAAAPRMEKSTLAFARLPAVDGGTAGADAAPPSFSSVLTALDPEARRQPGPDVSDLQGAGALTGVLPVLLEPAKAPDPTELLAQSMGLTLSLPPDAEAPLTAQADVSGLLLPAAPLVLDARVVVAGPGATWSEPVVGAAPAASPPRAMPPGGLSEAAADAFAPTMAPTMAISIAGDAKARPSRQGNVPAQQIASATSSATGNVASWSGEGLQPALDNVKGDARAAFAAQAERVASMSAPAPGEDGGGFQSLPGLRASERQTGRSVFVPLEGVSAGGAATSAYATNAAAGPGAAVGTEAPFAAGSSSEVAQKVHYWITRGTQSAELQLDAFGGGAVDVSIVLQGKEALVEFRSDQPEARRMLQDAMPQLKDMLQSEGLRLSSGFVGTSAQQDPHARRDGAPTVRTGRVDGATAPGPTGENARPTVVARTHALDVFV